MSEKLVHKVAKQFRLELRFYPQKQKCPDIIHKLKKGKTDDRPSFTLNDEGKYGGFKCFGCGAKGDAIKLIQLLTSYNFGKALEYAKQLDNSVHIETPRRSYRLSDLQEIINSTILEIFADETGQGWVQFYDGEPIKFCKIKSQQFEDFVRITISQELNEPKEAWIKPLIELYDSRARRSEKRKLHLRNAYHDGHFYLQLNETEAVKFTKHCYEKIKNQTIFINHSHQLPRGKDVFSKIENYQELKKFTNFKTKEETELFLDILPAYFFPEIAKPISLFRGDPGSAKSSSCYMMKAIIDPTVGCKEGIKFPTDPRDWAVIVQNHSFFFIDNVNKLTREQQDSCCRTITGTTVEERKLYTNLGTSLVNIKGTGCINAISLDNLQSDFLDRSLIWDLDRIPENERIDEIKFKEDFEKELPKIRGAIIEILSKAIKLLPKLKPKGILRLNSFEKAVIACGIARGRQQQDIVNALKLKSATQKDESIAQSTIAEPIITFMESGIEWAGTTKELWEQLVTQEFGSKKDITSDFPKNPNVLGKELQKISFVLKYRGIEIERLQRTKSKRILRISCHSCHQGGVIDDKKGDNNKKFVVTAPVTLSPGDSNDNKVTTEKKLLSPQNIDDKQTKVTTMTTILERVRKLEFIELGLTHQKCSNCGIMKSHYERYGKLFCKDCALSIAVQKQSA